MQSLLPDSAQVGASDPDPGANPGLICSSSNLCCCLTTSELLRSGPDVFTLTGMSVSLRLRKEGEYVKKQLFSFFLIHPSQAIYLKYQLIRSVLGNIASIIKVSLSSMHLIPEQPKPPTLLGSGHKRATRVKGRRPRVIAVERVLVNKTCLW